MTKAKVRRDVLRAILSDYRGAEAAVAGVVGGGPRVSVRAVGSLLDSSDLMERISLNNQAVSKGIRFFCTLVTVTYLCKYFVKFNSTVKVRTGVAPLTTEQYMAPARGLGLVLASRLASFTLNCISIVVLVLCLQCVLGLSFRKRVKGVLIMSFFKDLVNMSVKVFVNDFKGVRRNIEVKLVLKVSVMDDFLTKLVGKGVGSVIRGDIPFIGQVGPTSLVSSTFCYVGMCSSVAECCEGLVALTMVYIILIVTSFFVIEERHCSDVWELCRSRRGGCESSPPMSKRFFQDSGNASNDNQWKGLCRL